MSFKDMAAFSAQERRKQLDKIINEKQVSYPLPNNKVDMTLWMACKVWERKLDILTTLVKTLPDFVLDYENGMKVVDVVVKDCIYLVSAKSFYGQVLIRKDKLISLFNPLFVAIDKWFGSIGGWGANKQISLGITVIILSYVALSYHYTGILTPHESIAGLPIFRAYYAWVVVNESLDDSVERTDTIIVDDKYEQVPPETALAWENMTRDERDCSGLFSVTLFEKAYYDIVKEDIEEHRDDVDYIRLFHLSPFFIEPTLIYHRTNNEEDFITVIERRIRGIYAILSDVERDDNLYARILHTVLSNAQRVSDRASSRVIRQRKQYSADDVQEEYLGDNYGAV